MKRRRFRHPSDVLKRRKRVRQRRRRRRYYSLRLRRWWLGVKVGVGIYNGVGIEAAKLFELLKGI